MLLYMGSRVLAEHQILFMAAQCNRAGHYIFDLWFLSSIYLFSSPNLSRRRLDVCHTAAHGVALVRICRAISSQLRNVTTIGKKLLSSNIFSTCSHNMVNFGPLTAEIGPGVWDTPVNFNGFRILAALLHGTPVLGVSQTLRR